MRAITFPYTVHKGVAIPHIPLTLKINHTPRRFWAEDLDFDYRSGQPVNVQVGDGGFIPVYLHRLKMTLDEISFSATVGFSARLGVEFNLLGRKDVFELFDVTFSDSSRKITFFPYISPTHRPTGGK